MTPWLGRHGFGEAPTRAIVLDSRRISSGERIPGQGYPQRHGRPGTRRVRAADEPRRQGREPREGRAARRPRRRRRRRRGRVAREVERDRRRGVSRRGGRAARRRSVRRRDGRLGTASRRRAHRRLDHGAPSRSAEAFQHLLRLRPRGHADDGLPEDPPVRRRHRRPRLPRIRGGGAGARAGSRRRRGLAGRPLGLLRPPLSRALPDPGARGRPRRHRSSPFHPLHGEGPLGAAAPGAGRREPALRGCGGSGRRDDARTAELRALARRRSWGIVLAAAPDEETVIVAELDRARLADVRAKLPSLANRQPDAYRWPAPA